MRLFVFAFIAIATAGISPNLLAGPQCAHRFVVCSEGSALYRSCGNGVSAGCSASALAHTAYFGGALCEACKSQCSIQVNSTDGAATSDKAGADALNCPMPAAGPVDDGADVFGEFSIDISGSLPYLDDLAAVDPAHAAYLLTFGDGYRSSSEQPRYGSAVTVPSMSYEFYQTAAASLMAGTDGAELESAAERLGLSPSNGVIRLEYWLIEAPDDSVQLRMRSSNASVKPVSRFDGKATSRPTGGVIESLEFDLRQVIRETTVTLSKVSGANGLYVITGFEAK